MNKKSLWTYIFKVLTDNDVKKSPPKCQQKT